MIVFRTEFPVLEKLGIDDFAKIGLDWVSGSPYTSLAAQINQISSYSRDFELDSPNGKEKLKTKRYIGDAEQIIGFEYFSIDGTDEWTTRIILYKSDSDSHISIETDCECRKARRHEPRAQIPYVMRMFSNVGSKDGEFLHITKRPYNLQNYQIDNAISLLNGETGNTRPIVYLSSTRGQKHVINPSKLAQKLFGIAHVVVEPDFHFGERLAIDMRGKNPTSGAVGIYWPSGAGTDILFRSGEPYDNFTKKIIYKIIDSLRSMRIGNQYRWTYLEQRLNEVHLNKLRQEGKNAENEYVKAFDEENKTLRKDLEDANSENIYLKSEVSRLKQLVANRGQVINVGQEQELVAGEFSDFIIGLLQKECQQAQVGNRRHDVCGALLAVNTIQGNMEKLKEDLRNLLSRWEGSHADISNLKRLGFCYQDEGKHIKITHNRDERYSVILAKTPSDSRSSLNNASDAIKKLF